MRKSVGQGSYQIHDLAQIIRLMVASFPGVPYRQMFYRVCDNFKNNALAMKGGNFETKITLSHNVKQDLQWWRKNIVTTVRILTIPRLLKMMPVMH